MKSSRLFQIVYHLLQKGQTTAPELAQVLEVSPRTVYRDIEALCQAGVPIVTAQGQGGGIRLMDGYVLNKEVISADEKAQLLLAVKSLASATQETDLLRKLGALFQSAGEDWLSVDLSRWGQTGKRDVRFEQIKRAILEKRMLRFNYAASDGRVGLRAVKPARLCYKTAAWYLQGYCLTRRAFRTFKLSRMSAMEVTNEQFSDGLVPPPIETEHPESWPEIRLRFPPEMAFRVMDEFEPCEISPQPDDSLIVTTRMPLNDDWLCGYLLSFGGKAQVLAPEALRTALALWARESYLQYEKDLPSDANLPETVRFHAVSCPCPHGEHKQRKVHEMEQKFCQSCGMPMNDEAYGTEKNGTPSADYCAYCYQSGAFTRDCTMEDMIAFCAPYMAEGNPGMTQEDAKARMRAFFPQLKRWARK